VPCRHRDSCIPRTPTDNKIYEYLVDASTGALTPTSQGSLVTASQPGRIASDQGGFRLYVANTGSEELSAYFINRDDGSLQAVPGSPATLSGYPNAVVVHPSGDFVYVATTSGAPDYTTNYIYAFKVQSDGSLTAVSGSPFASKYWPTQAIIDSTGSYLYAATYSAAYVEAYDINKSTGALTPMAGQPFALPEDQAGCASGEYDLAFGQSDSIWWCRKWIAMARSPSSMSARMELSPTRLARRSSIRFPTSSNLSACKPSPSIRSIVGGICMSTFPASYRAWTSLP
jgi:6-phosphogluconolactonase (cycloisomerase 2 family)